MYHDCFLYTGGLNIDVEKQRADLPFLEDKVYVCWATVNDTLQKSKLSSDESSRKRRREADVGEGESESARRQSVTGGRMDEIEDPELDALLCLAGAAMSARVEWVERPLESTTCPLPPSAAAFAQVIISYTCK